MYLRMIRRNWIAIREDKMERNVDGPKSNENVTEELHSVYHFVKM